MAAMRDPLGEYMAASARRSAERSAAEAVRELEEAPARLGLPEAEFPETKAALRAYHTDGNDLAEGSLLIGILVFVLLLPPFVSAAVSGTTSLPVNENDPDPVYVNVYAVIAALTLPWPPLVWLIRRTRAGGASVRHRLTVRTTRAAVLCADILERPSLADLSRLRALDRRCRRIERDLLRAHHTVGTIASSSPRHESARRHAAHVAGALRQDLVRLDSEPDTALRDLARKLLTIGERYAQGRVGALLPEDDLRDVVPLSVTREHLKESLRLVAAVLAALGAALAVHPLLPLLGAPEFLRPWCYVAAALVPGLLIAGPRRVLSYLSFAP
ncbi:hypothetical protein [Streptomyces albus]|uniref:hypothetical protein n=1 Tax=Streptomyces albus TaxID=1888 RepID=UPI00068B43CF|nr:hypothetical protein [Streptomyces albus]